MPKELLQSIQQFRDELKQADTVATDEQQELLRTLIEIETLLHNSEIPLEDEHQPLIDRFKETIWEMEKSHPTLTFVVGRVMDNLNRMGI